MHIIAAIFAFVAASGTAAQQTTHAPHEHSEMDERGAKVMGFDQEKTIHHFHLYQDGGAIDVSVKDATDTGDLSAIRAHLPHIAMRFAQGNFDAPMLVHDRNVPGTDDMTRLKGRLTFTYVETSKGGRVDIVTKHADALAALHAFLTFQIRDHRTGDSEDVRKR